MFVISISLDVREVIRLLIINYDIAAKSLRQLAPLLYSTHTRPLVLLDLINLFSGEACGSSWLVLQAYCSCNAATKGVPINFSGTSWQHK